MKRLGKLVLYLLLLVAVAGAHELQENRATLVVRDKIHLSLTVYVAWSDALHLVLAPQRPMPEFLAVYSGMRTEDLQKQLDRAQIRFRTATRLYLATGAEVTLTGWAWPDARKVQSLLQQRIMQAVVDPTAHSHEEPLEVHADAVLPGEVTALRLQFPGEFGKVLVVAYRPTQVWVEPGAASPVIRF